MGKEQLFEALQLNNGVVLKDRFALAPMDPMAGDADGKVGEVELDYYTRRNNVGQLLITGAIAVSETGMGSPNQNLIYDDQYIPELAKVSQALKAKGNKAIAQIYHGGREAGGSYMKLGKVVAPSKLEFSFLTYVPEELTDAEVRSIIDDYGKAAERAMQAGFDGVEIHGANHYLIQQFFSAFSNVRTDFWGGSLEKRMNFPLAVVKKVKEVVQQSGKTDFIIGYRISPEEVHGETVGYTVDDSLKLIDKLAEAGIDYIHTSTFGNLDYAEAAYKRPGQKGTTDQPMNQLVKSQIAGRTALIVSGAINSVESALDGLNYGDMVSMGTAALADPDLKEKIRLGKEDTINLDVTGRLDDLFLPPGLIALYDQGFGMLPPIKGLTKE